MRFYQGRFDAPRVDAEAIQARRELLTESRLRGDMT
jgi:hypothetical protein